MRRARGRDPGRRAEDVLRHEPGQPVAAPALPQGDRVLPPDVLRAERRHGRPARPVVAGPGDLPGRPRRRPHRPDPPVPGDPRAAAAPQGADPEHPHGGREVRRTVPASGRRKPLSDTGAVDGQRPPCPCSDRKSGGLQRAKGKGQRAKGKGQRAKGKGQRAKNLGKRKEFVGEPASAKGSLTSDLCPLPFAPILLAYAILLDRSWGRKPSPALSWKNRPRPLIGHRSGVRGPARIRPTSVAYLS